MRPSSAALILLLACAASCRQENAPTERIAEKAEEIVAPAAKAPTPWAKGRYAPQDTCAKVDGADAFRRQLAEAVRRRDAEALADLAAEDVKLDFGGGTGSAELRRRLDDPSRELWRELEELMALGCSANARGGITIPWYFDQDLGGVDAMSHWLVTGQDVPVLEAPAATARPLATISWDLVELAVFEPDSDYQQVELPEGAVGFIASDKLRSLIDYRLIASSRNGRWRITTLVAGD